MTSVAAARALSARPRMAATKTIFSARPRTAAAAAPISILDFLQTDEQFWFDYFKFDSLQFEKRVKNDVALLKKLTTAKMSFSHKDYQSYYVPKLAATSPIPSATALRTLFEVHPFPTSNPFLLAFLQTSLTVDESSEFYGITVTPEDVRFHLWEDLIRHVVQRITESLSFKR